MSLSIFSQEQLINTKKIEVQKPKKVKDIVYVNDSIIDYKFSTTDTSWSLYKKFISTNFDQAENITEQELYTYNSTEHTWEPYSLTQMTYFENSYYDTYCMFPYNTNILNWEPDTAFI
jgi:hypothetical protein